MLGCNGGAFSLHDSDRIGCMKGNSDQNRIPVVLITGSGRSGSTLFARMLGRYQGFCAFGELVRIWERGFLGNELCGCSTPFLECEFWQNVSLLSEGALTSSVAEEAARLCNITIIMRRAPFLIWPSTQPAEFRQGLARYQQILSRLYGVLHNIEGVEFIVDSSKSGLYGLVLSRIPSICLHTIHLVRDSRAVAYSLLRKRVRTEIRARTEYMASFGVAQASLYWSLRNLNAERLRQVSARYLRVRYEEWARNPQKVLLQVQQAVSGRPTPCEGIGDYEVDLPWDHTVSGNPNRFQTGPVQVQCDDEWRHRLSPARKLAITCLTWPLLLRYGFSLTSRIK
jgi:hypothetical protein